VRGARVLRVGADGQAEAVPLATLLEGGQGQGATQQGWLWVDLLHPLPQEVHAVLKALGLDEAGLRPTLASVGDRSDGAGWLTYGHWGYHLALGWTGPPPDYPVQRSLHAVVTSQALVTFRDGPWPGLSAMARRLRQGKGPPFGPGDDPLSLLVAGAVQGAAARARRQVRGVVDRAEAVASAIVRTPRRPDLWNEILEARRSVLHLRRRYAALSRALATLSSTAPTVGEEAKSLFRDLSDRISDSVDTLDALRESLASTVEAYASIQSNEINRVMKLLTVVSVVFLPSTLIASIYGMNFSIPEVHWPGGYGYSLVLMAVVTAALLAFLRNRGWL
jgi:magnesium/cobalt transport protein CorA